MDKQTIKDRVITSLKSILTSDLSMNRFTISNGINYKSLNNYLLGARCPLYGSYYKLFVSITTNKSWDEAEEDKRKAVHDFCDAFSEEFDKGYTYLQIEADTKISHSNLYEYKKHKVNDISLYNVVTLIEYMHLDITVPGIWEK